MPRDLRSFLQEYEARYRDDVVHIDKEVNCHQEVSAIVQQLEQQNKYPLLIFSNVLNPEGKKAKQSLVTNVSSSRIRIARICNSTYETLGRDFYQVVRTKRVEPVVVSKAEAPVQEVVKRREQINLLEFPALWHIAMDAGHYFSAGFLTTYDPDSGIDNSALLRGWIYEKDTIRVCIARRPGHSGWNLYKHELKNQDMRCAFWQGHHPLGYYGGLTKLPYPGSHWEAMGGILGEPLRLVASESLGDDFLVPADAELVVEGIVEANKRYPEGPFGEFPGYVGPQVLNPQMKVTAITHRKDFIWYNIEPGGADHRGSGGMSLEGQVWEALKPRFPSLINVYFPLSGLGRYHCYIQFKNPGPGEARQAIAYALGLNGFFIKHVFCFDDDVDIFNPGEVMWAIATRSQWGRDVIIIPHAKTCGLDPSASAGRPELPGVLGDIGGIDCTKPWGEPYEVRLRGNFDEGVLEKTKLVDFIPPDKLARLKTESI